MNEILEKLFIHYGSHSEVAKALGYSERQYRNIRQRVEKGDDLQPRVALWITTKSSLLQSTKAGCSCLA